MSNPSTTDPTTDPQARRIAALENLVIGRAAVEFAESLEGAAAGIVVAEPGAGKTTGMPLALLGARWLTQREANGIVIVEPRRVAARQAALRMASMLGEQISSKDKGRVGLRSRDETSVGRETRIEVVTDGVLPRMLRTDPGFTGRSVVIFDEFHERSLDTDLGLALALSAQSLLRPDLVIVVMSATLEVERVKALLAKHSNGPVLSLSSPGRAFPVEVSSYTGAGDLAQRVADSTVDAVRRSKGDVLIFLPGVHEINVCARRLRDQPSLAHTTILPLHARGSVTDTAHALRPSVEGEQRIVLATSLAQTSVTIDGVTTVIDSGFVRRPVRDPSTGLSRLATMRVSKATAAQRAGRAGRTSPGRAIQLWSSAEWAQFDETEPPEILDSDLSGLALAAADWGVLPTDLAWTDPPSIDSWAAAERELTMLGAIDRSGSITELGRFMAGVPAHPRIAALMSSSHSDSESAASAASMLAAYLSDSDWFSAGAPTDLVSRLVLLAEDSPTNDDFITHAAKQRFRKALQRLAAGRRMPSVADLDRRTIGELALRAFPERLAVRTETSGERFQFANGLVLPLDRTERSDSAAVVGAQMIVALELDSDRKRGVIRVAAVLDPDQVVTWANSSQGGSIRMTVTTRWENARLAASEDTELVTPVGSLTIRRRAVSPARDACIDAVGALLETDPDAVVWTEAARELWARIQLHRSTPTDSWQGLVLDWLNDTLGASPKSFSLASIDVHAALMHHLDLTGSARTLAQRAPTTITLHERTHRIHYATDSGRPTIRVRVQDLFGTQQIPGICDGSQPLTIELLSPAGRVVGVTDDLGRFWTVGYPGLRSDLRGRYPKHQWPEDPAHAEPRRTTPRH